ncbi:hypothetical protein [Luteolibacter sp. LG18]|uniref:hypothetical protein n=1 Tax=Luteolibacter sp. LG18 TaxID=2819286 RepID=UPI002B2E11A4|nr:hypothetical protein llg_43380 [Luteolibacter sp. LG18]
MAGVRRGKGAATEVIETVRACFIPDPENPARLIHPRLEEERGKQREWREKSAEGGRKSAAKRRENVATKSVVKPAKAAKGGAKGGSTLQSSSSSSSSEDITPLPPRGDRSSSSSTDDLFQIEAESRNRRKTPIPDALRQRIGGMVGRRPHTTWSPKELKALRELGPIDSEDLDLLESYYLADIPEEKDYRRRSLARLLVHWHGEIDHARHHRSLQRAA